MKPLSCFKYFSAGEMQDGQPVIRTETFANKILEHLDRLREDSGDQQMKARKGSKLLDFNDVGLLSNDLGDGFGKLTTVTPPVGAILGYTVDWYYLNGEQLISPSASLKYNIPYSDYVQKIMDAIRKNNNGVVGQADFLKYLGYRVRAGLGAKISG